MYQNHVATTKVDIPLTVTAAAQRELRGADETLAETTDAVIEAYAGFIGEILERKIDDGDIDADGGVTITAEDIQVQREMAWVPTLDDPGMTPEQQAEERAMWIADCKAAGIDPDHPMPF